MGFMALVDLPSSIDSIIALLGTLVSSVDGFDSWIPIVLDTANLFIDFLPGVFGGLAAIALVIFIIKIVLGANT